MKFERLILQCIFVAFFLSCACKEEPTEKMKKPPTGRNCFICGSRVFVFHTALPWKKARNVCSAESGAELYDAMKKEHETLFRAYSSRIKNQADPHMFWTKWDMRHASAHPRVWAVSKAMEESTIWDEIAKEIEYPRVAADFRRNNSFRFVMPQERLQFICVKDAAIKNSAGCINVTSDPKPSLTDDPAKSIDINDCENVYITPVDSACPKRLASHPRICFTYGTKFFEYNACEKDWKSANMTCNELASFDLYHLDDINENPEVKVVAEKLAAYEASFGHNEVKIWTKEYICRISYRGNKLKSFKSLVAALEWLASLKQSIIENIWHRMKYLAKLSICGNVVLQKTAGSELKTTVLLPSEKNRYLCIHELNNLCPFPSTKNSDRMPAVSSTPGMIEVISHITSTPNAAITKSTMNVDEPALKTESYEEISPNLPRITTPFSNHPLTCRHTRYISTSETQSEQETSITPEPIEEIKVSTTHGSTSVKSITEISNAKVSHKIFPTIELTFPEEEIPLKTSITTEIVEGDTVTTLYSSTQKHTSKNLQTTREISNIQETSGTTGDATGSASTSTSIFGLDSTAENHSGYTIRITSEATDLVEESERHTSYDTTQVATNTDEHATSNFETAVPTDDQQPETTSGAGYTTDSANIVTDIPEQTELTSSSIVWQKKLRAYQFHSSPEVWIKAREICKSAGQQLYIPKDVAEVQWVVGKVEEDIGKGKLLSFWTGYSLCSSSSSIRYLEKAKNVIEKCVNHRASKYLQVLLVEDGCLKISIKANSLIRFIPLQQTIKLPFLCANSLNTPKSTTFSSPSSSKVKQITWFCLTAQDTDTKSIYGTLTDFNRKLSEFAGKCLQSRNRFFPSNIPSSAHSNSRKVEKFFPEPSTLSAKVELEEHDDLLPTISPPTNSSDRDKSRNYKLTFTTHNSAISRRNKLKISKGYQPIDHRIQQLRPSFTPKRVDEVQLKNAARVRPNFQSISIDGQTSLSDYVPRKEFKTWKSAKLSCESMNYQLFAPVTLREMTELGKLSYTGENSKFWTNWIACDYSWVSHPSKDNRLKDFIRSSFGNFFGSTAIEVLGEGCGAVAVEIGNSVSFHILQPELKFHYICDRKNDLPPTAETSSKIPFTKTSKTPITRPSPYCPKTFAHGINWPRTKSGKFVFSRCPKGKYGKAEWFCSNSGKFDGKPLVLCEEMDCSKPLVSIFNKENDVSYLAERLSRCSDDALKRRNIVKDLMQIIKNRRDHIRIKIESHGDNLTGYGKETYEAVNDALGAYDTLMEEDSQVWNMLDDEQKVSVSMGIIKETEETAWLIGCEATDDSLKKNNMEMQVISLQHTTEVTFENEDQTEDIAKLPAKLTPRNAHLCRENMDAAIAVTYKNLQRFLLPSDAHYKITSKVMGVSVGDVENTYSLGSETVFIRLNHPPKPRNWVPKCVFLNWDKSKNRPYDDWDTEGCEMVNSTETYTECLCNHLTNFAILMDFGDNELSEHDEYCLSLVSLIFCCLSSVALILAIIIYITVRSLRNRRNIITCNLAACLLCMNILVQTGLNRVGKNRCFVISVLLQYSVLSSFMWMLLEGALLYKMVILVFESSSIRLPYVYSIAYGIPLVIIVISSSIRPEHMIREKYCWPSSEKGMIWSVTGPIALIIMVNVIIFAMTMNAAFKIEKINVNKKSITERKKNLIKRLKGMMSLMCLLGLTWIVGFFYVPEKPAVTAYIFVCLNGLQGVFLFVTQMISNDAVRHKLFLIYKNMAKFSATSTWNSLLLTAKQPKVKVIVEKRIDSFSELRPDHRHPDFVVHPTTPVLLDPIKPASRLSVYSDKLHLRHPFGINYEMC